MLVIAACGDRTPATAPANATETLRALEAVERLIDAGRVDEALRAAESCARTRPDDALAAEMLARARMAAGASAVEIAEAYARAADLRPDSPGLQGVAGITAMQAGRIDVAITRLERAAALEPGNPQHALQLSTACAAATHWPQARAAAARAVALAPLEPSAHLALAHALQGSGDRSEAAAAARAALACAPADATLRRSVADLLVACDEAPAAVEMLVVSASAPEAPAETIASFARALRASGRFAQAAGQWERLTATPTSPWRPCVEAAACHALAGDAARAAEWNSRARERGAPPDALSPTDARRP